MSGGDFSTTLSYSDFNTSGALEVVLAEDTHSSFWESAQEVWFFSDARNVEKSMCGLFFFCTVNQAKDYNGVSSQ